MLKKLYSVCHLDKKSGLEIRVVQENHVNKMTRFDAILYKIFLSNFLKLLNLDTMISLALFR